MTNVESEVYEWRMWQKIQMGRSASTAPQSIPRFAALSSAARREDSLQGDNEHQTKEGLHVVVRLVAARD